MAALASLTARAYYRAVSRGAEIDAAIELADALERDASRRRRYVEARLRDVLCAAAARVPFYRRLRADGFDPQTGDLARLPVVTRAAMQVAPADFTADPLPAGATQNQTGGSSGTPLLFWQDPGQRARMRHDLHRGYRMCGYRPGDRALFVWGSDYDARAHRGVLGRGLDRWGHNRRWINAFDAGPGVMRQAIETIRAWRPDVLIAYATSAWLLARAAAAASPRSSFGLRAAQVTAELLTPTMRAAIADGLGTPVFNRYGCREVGNVAHECEVHDGLHVFEDSHLVEILDDEARPLPEGRPGRIVVTNFGNRATPFLRYDLGDVGRLHTSPCACGRSTPRLELLEGRIGEIVTSPSGRWIHGEFFTHLFYKVAGVRRFRVVQEDVRRLHIQIEGEGPVDEGTLRFLTETIRREGDPDFDVRCEIVAHIPPSPSGKYRFVESRVPLRVAG